MHCDICVSSLSCMVRLVHTTHGHTNMICVLLRIEVLRFLIRSPPRESPEKEEINSRVMGLLLLCWLRQVYDVQAYTCVIVTDSTGNTTSADVPGGRLCLSFSALSGSSMESVYRYLEQRTLNLVCALPVGVFAATFFIRASMDRRRERCSIREENVGIQ